MPFLDADERQALRIENFIFHVVHHGGEEPILFDNAPLGEFEPFFTKLVSETLRGNQFLFTPGSRTLAALRLLRDDPAQFVAASKDLARDFHNNDGRFHRGILIVTTLRVRERRLFSLIKYDHEPMVAFDTVNTTAALRAVVTGLTESPRAIQKSAIVELDDEGGRLIVVDRSKRTGITDFFREFLGVTRLQDEAEMTGAVQRALLKTVKEHAGALPTDVTAHVKRRLVEIAERRVDFDSEEFFADFFGAYGSPAVKATFDLQLDQNGIAGEAFTFDRGSLPMEATSRYRTLEGVSIVVPPGARDTLNIETQEDGSSVVTIRTRHVIER